MSLDANRLRALFSYDPATGRFARLVACGSRGRAGPVLPRADRHGHLRLSVDGREYAVHRLAWLYMTGHWPAGDVDHRNGERADNRWENLRDVPHRVNLQNRQRATSANKTGLLGVSAHGPGFMARLKTNGAVVHLGTFATPEAAHAAYLKAKRELHEGCTL